MGSFDEVDCVIGVDSVGEFPAVASALEHVADREGSFTGEFVELVTQVSVVCGGLHQSESPRV